MRVILRNHSAPLLQHRFGKFVNKTTFAENQEGRVPENNPVFRELKLFLKNVLDT